MRFDSCEFVWFEDCEIEICFKDDCEYWLYLGGWDCKGGLWGSFGGGWCCGWCCWGREFRICWGCDVVVVWLFDEVDWCWRCCCKRCEVVCCWEVCCCCWVSKVVSWVNWLLGSWGGGFICCCGVFMGCCGGLGIKGRGGNCRILDMEGFGYLCCVGGLVKLEICFDESGFEIWLDWVWSCVFWCVDCCWDCWRWNCVEGFI